MFFLHLFFNFFFFFNDTATTEIYTLSLHDALPICAGPDQPGRRGVLVRAGALPPVPHRRALLHRRRSEEHTSELQSLAYLVCRLLLEKKKKKNNIINNIIINIYNNNILDKKQIYNI